MIILDNLLIILIRFIDFLFFNCILFNCNPVQIISDPKERPEPQR